MSVDLANSEMSPDPRIGAWIDSMKEGAIHDRGAIDPEASASASHGYQIAEEALRMLRLMSEQLNSAQEQSYKG
jgi:hypothetical protein